MKRLFLQVLVLLVLNPFSVSANTLAIGSAIASCATGQTITVVAGVWACTNVASSNIPAGLITFVNTGTCPTGWTEVVALNGKTLFGTLAANADVGTTGGSDAIIQTGSNSTSTVTPLGSNSTSTVTPLGTNSTSTVTPLGTIAWPAGVPTAASEASHNHNGSTISWPAGVPTFAGSALGTHQHTLTATGTNAASATSGNCAATNVAIGTGALSACKATAPNLTVTAQTFTGSSASTSLVSGGTPAGTISWPIGVPTNGVTGAGSSHTHTLSWPAGVPTFSGSSSTVGAQTFTGSLSTVSAQTFTGSLSTVAAPTFTGNSFDNRSAFVKVIFCSKN